MSMSLDIFHMEGRLLGRVARIVDGDGDASLGCGICLSGIDVASLEVLGMDDTVTAWVAFVFGKAGACKDGKAYVEGLQIEHRLL